MFRKAVYEDCEAVYELICGMEGRRLPFERFAGIFKSQLDEPERCCCLVCELEGRVCAVLNLRFEEQLHHAARIAEVMELAVAEPYRRQGLGAALLERACGLARERGCGQIELACNRLRRDAHRFYLREGLRDFHLKFSKPLYGEAPAENRLGL